LAKYILTIFEVLLKNGKEKGKESQALAAVLQVITRPGNYSPSEDKPQGRYWL
jgi:hypothetical protein